MVTLAEIADKMLTTSEMWIVLTLASVPFAAIAVIHRWSALAVLPFAIAYSAFLAWSAYHEAYLEGSFSEAVWTELGVSWVANSLVSSLLPAIITLIIAAVKWCPNPRPQVTGNARPRKINMCVVG